MDRETLEKIYEFALEAEKKINWYTLGDKSITESELKKIRLDYIQEKLWVT